MSRRSSLGYGTYTRSYNASRYRRTNDKRNRRKKIIILAVTAIAVASAVWGIVSVFGKKQEKQDTKLLTEISQTAQPQKTEEPSAVKQDLQTEESSVQESSADPNIKGYFDGDVFIYDRQGYEMFYGNDKSARLYAETVSSFKKALGKDVNVYNMVIPTHSEFGLPEKYLADSVNQKSNLNALKSAYTEDVKYIDIYDTLESHKGEYIYFGTDHNWTASGAYYAYQKFCETAKTDAVDIKSLAKGTINDFEGSLTVATQTEKNPDGNRDLLKNPDTVTYYRIPGDYTCMLRESMSSEEKEVPLIAGFAEGSNAYSAFIWGDNPYMKITAQNKTGKKLCIIKDSYGCAFAPFTVANYDEVYIVDPRYYDGNVIDYIKKNKYTDVLIINGIMTANTDLRIEELKSVAQ